MSWARSRGIFPERSPKWTTASGRLFRASPNIYTANFYSTTVQAKYAKSYSIVSGSLPSGMSLNATTGVVSGTPTGIADFTQDVVYSFTIRATNSYGYRDQAFNISVGSYYVGRVCHPEIGENGASTATAPSGYTFTRIDFSSYGTPGGSCPNYSISGCHSGAKPGDLGSLPRTSIYVAATNANFGDPCAGTVKHYRGTYSYSPITP